MTDGIPIIAAIEAAMDAIGPPPKPITIVTHPHMPTARAWKVDEADCTWYFVHSDAIANFRLAFDSFDALGSVHLRAFDDEARDVLTRHLDRLVSADALALKPEPLPYSPPWPHGFTN